MEESPMKTYKLFLYLVFWAVIAFMVGIVISMLVGCSRHNHTNWKCHEVRYVHADDTYEYITVCSARAYAPERPWRCREISSIDDKGDICRKMECSDDGENWWDPVDDD